MNSSFPVSSNYRSAWSAALPVRSSTSDAVSPPVQRHSPPPWSSNGNVHQAANAAAVEPISSDAMPEPTLAQRMAKALDAFETEAASAGGARHPKRSTASIYQLIQAIPNTWAASIMVRVPVRPTFEPVLNVRGEPGSASTVASASSMTETYPGRATAAEPSLPGSTSVRVPLLQALQGVAEASTDSPRRAAAAAAILRQALPQAPLDDPQPASMEHAPISTSRPGDDPQLLAQQRIAEILKDHGYELPRGMSLRIPASGSMDNATEQLRRDNTDALCALPRRHHTLLHSVLRELNKQFPTRPVFDALTAIRRADQRLAWEEAGVPFVLARGRRPLAIAPTALPAAARAGLEMHRVQQRRPIPPTQLRRNGRLGASVRASLSERGLVDRVRAVATKELEALTPAQRRLLESLQFKLPDQFGFRMPRDESKDQRNSAIRLSNTVDLLERRPEGFSDNAFMNLLKELSAGCPVRPLTTSMDSLVNAKQVLAAKARAAAAAAAASSAALDPAGSARP